MTTPQERPTFQVAYRLRCLGIIGRDSFLSFQTDFETIVNKITSTDDKELWEYVATLFDVSDYADCVPINSANLSITWAPVIKCLNNMTVDWNRDISIQKRENIFAPIISLARDLIAKQLNVRSDEVAMCRGSSDANSVINNGLDFKGTRNQVVVWSENHPTNNIVAWSIRKQRFTNMEIVEVNTTGKPFEDEDKIVEYFKEKIDKEKTRIVTFSQISHLSGTRLPAQRLCTEIHQISPEIHVHCDGAQAWGGVEQDLRHMGCDSSCGSCHKWMLGPKETGFLYVKKNRITDFWPKDIGYNTKVESPTVDLPDDASRFELLGQRNDLSILGMLYTADLMGLIGYDKIEKRIKELSTKLREELATVTPKCFQVETPENTALYHGIIVLKFDDGWYLPSAPDEEISKAIFNALYNNYKIGVSSKKGNRMRFSPHINNTMAHMVRAVEAVKVILSEAAQKNKRFKKK